MFRTILIAVSLLVLLALSACGGTSAPNQVQVTDQDAGKSFDLAKGGTLEVVLTGNPTTGYVWGLKSGNEAALKPATDYTFKPDNTNLVGSGGKFTFKFQAAGAGTAKLVFVNARPWEANDQTAQTFEVTVNVK